MHKRKKRPNLFKQIFYRMGQLVIRLLHFIITTCPLKISTSLVGTLGKLSYFFTSKYRTRAMRNLQQVFGNTMSSQERKRIYRSITENVLKDMVEMLYSTGPNKSVIAERITVRGEENLKEALSRGKGVVAVSGHLGNFTLLGFGLVSRGYPANVVTRPVREKEIERTLQQYYENQGTKFIFTKPPQECVKKMLKALRNNEIICLLVDQAKKHGSVYADFFGRPAATTTTPALLSLRTGAPVIPFFIIRNENDTHTIFIEPAIEIKMTGDRDENVFRITTEINKVIQTYVEKYPAQWSYWTARRWKYQPGGKEEGVDFTPAI